MNAVKAVELMRKYNQCPDCGNDKIGNGQGVLNIEENTFFRSCKCGWSIKIKEEN